MPSGSKHKPLYTHLYFQVLVAIALGVLLGLSSRPSTAAAMKPLGDGFIKLIKMMIAPIIFTTVVVGIAQDGRHEGGRPRRPQGADLLRGGLDAGPGDRPGRRQRREARASGSTPTCAPLDTKAVAGYTTPCAIALDRRASSCTSSPTPWSARSPAARSSRCCSSRSCSAWRWPRLGEQGQSRWSICSISSRTRSSASSASSCGLAPIGAFGAMAFTVGQYGVGTLFSLGKLMACVYITCFLFVFVVLGAIARAHRVQPLVSSCGTSRRRSSSCSGPRRRSRRCRG